MNGNLKRLLDGLALTGAIILVFGLYFLLIRAGLPCQDPTPEMSFEWNVNSRVGEVLTLLGAVSFAAGFVGKRILRQYRTKTASELCTRLACIFSDVSYENSLKYDSIPASFS